MIKAVAFDIDGTLYPFAYMKLALARSYLAHPRAMSLYHHIRKHFRAAQESLHQDTFRQREASLAPSGHPDAQRVLESLVYGSFARSFAFIKPFREVRPTILGLRRKGCRIGFLSDFPVIEKLRLLELEDLADAALGPEETLYLKPHRRGFDMLSEALGVPGDEILFIGDSYDKDVLGALNAGMQAALVNNRRSRGCLQFKSWRGLSAYLESLEEVKQ